MPFSFTANSILLSTITDRGIQGAEPRLHRDLEAEIAAEAFNRFGFTYNDVNYDDNNISSFPLIAASTKVSAFKSQLKSTFKDTLIGNDATDANGDGNFKLVGIDNTNINKELGLDELSIKIRDGNNIDVSDLVATKDKTFCELSSSNPPPYKIEISNNLRLTTEYGDPRKKDYTATTTETSLKQPSKRYSIDVAGLCDLRPSSMQVYIGGAGIIKYIQGYNPDTWTPGNISGSGHTRIQTGGGFKPDSGFPTTGFYKARFSLIGSGGDQSNYKCEKESGGDWVDYSTSAASSALGEGCGIMYNTVARPTTPITINMQYTHDGGSTWTQVDRYTIQPPTLWAVAMMTQRKYKQDNNVYTDGVFEAANLCIGKTGTAITTNIMSASDAAKNFFKRNEITNTPIANLPSTNAVQGGLYARDIGTFMGEWGNGHWYPGSGWELWTGYWTSEVELPGRHFHVGMEGYCYARYLNDGTPVVMCRG